MQLNIENAGKRYRGDSWGLRDFSLDIHPGVLGLLGPNGAGKSTLMRMLATITKPTQGIIRWDGTDIRQSPDRVRQVLGYLPQDFGVYPNLTPVEFLEYIAAAKGLDYPTSKRRIEDLLQLVNLTDVEATATHIAIRKKGHLVTHDTPESLLWSVEGKVWEWIVPSEELVDIKRRYIVSSTMRRSDGVRVRVVAESAPPGGHSLTIERNRMISQWGSRSRRTISFMKAIGWVDIVQKSLKESILQGIRAGVKLFSHWY